MMAGRLIAMLAGVAVAVTCGAALAHHSFAMFDEDHPIDIEGTVKEFKFIAPHTFIMLEVKDGGGKATIWALEGGAPTALVREGWTPVSLKAGDELKLSIAPLRSGQPGGAWTFKGTRFRDGKPIVANN
jgi:hypothetical protein